MRQTESIVRIFKRGPSKIRTNKDPNILDTEKNLMDKIGMKVTLNNKKNNSGTLIFEYKESEQLDRLINVIKNNY